MELVEGETLADRINAVRFLSMKRYRSRKGICEALEAAHEKAIIHRDLKPANMKITPEGKVKVLDFGLAKVVELRRPANTVNSPPMTNGGTQRRADPGNAAYMSPEQAQGKDASTGAADIWAVRSASSTRC